MCIIACKTLQLWTFEARVVLKTARVRNSSEFWFTIGSSKRAGKKEILSEQLTEYMERELKTENRIPKMSKSEHVDIKETTFRV